MGDEWLGENMISDDELQEMVLKKLYHSFPPLRELGQCFDAEVKGGVVTLKGWVRTETIRDLAREAASEVKGVKDVRMQLLCDEEVEKQVALALEKDPQTVGSFPGVFVDSYCGEVKLWGTVSSSEDIAVAGGIVLSVPGVRALRNDLKVRAMA